jgi:hypothetical protein
MSTHIIIFLPSIFLEVKLCKGKADLSTSHVLGEPGLNSVPVIDRITLGTGREATLASVVYKGVRGGVGKRSPSYA